MFEELRGKKVAFLRPYFAMGGIESICFETIRQLSNYGVEFTLFTSSLFFDLNEQRLSNVIIKKLPNVVLLDNGYPKDDEEFLKGSNLNYVVSELKKCDIDVLVFLWHTSKIPYTLKQVTSTKLVFWLHSMPFWEVNNRKAVWSNYHRNPRLSNIPQSIITILSKIDIFIFSRKIKKQYINQIDFFDSFITISSSYKEDIISYLGSDISHKLTYIANTLSINNSPILEKQKEILFAGRLVLLDKQVDRLLSIWKKIQDDIPEWSLKICGDGWMKDELIAKSKDMGLVRYEFCGNQDNLQPFYDRASIVVLTSNYEGWPMSLIEAQNNGVVPIAFDCCSGVRSIIGQGDAAAGVLVFPFDENDYMAQLKRLCLDDEYRLRLQKATLKKRYEYTFEQNIPLWRDIICM